MSIKFTDWEITGSSGLTVKAGTPIANVEIGASYIRLPIENTRTKQKVMLQGIGAGVGAGLSISTPIITVSGSLDQFPADGIGRIIKGTAPLNRQYTASDFFGEILVFSLSGGKEITGQLSGLLWLKDSVEVCLARLNCSSGDLVVIAQQALLKAAGVSLPPVGVALKANDLYQRTKAAGCFVATNLESQLIGAGADIFSYRVRA